MEEEKHLLLLMLQVSWSTPFWMGGPLHCGSPDGGRALARPLSDLLLALALKVPPEPLPAGVPLPSRHSSCLGHRPSGFKPHSRPSPGLLSPARGSPGLDPILTRCLSSVSSGEWVPAPVPADASTLWAGIPGSGISTRAWREESDHGGRMGRAQHSSPAHNLWVYKWVPAAPPGHSAPQTPGWW